MSPDSPPPTRHRPNGNRHANTRAIFSRLYQLLIPDSNLILALKPSPHGPGRASSLPPSFAGRSEVLDGRLSVAVAQFLGYPVPSWSPRRRDGPLLKLSPPAKQREPLTEVAKDG